MGNCVSLSIPLDQAVSKVSQWLEDKSGYIHNLEKNLDALTTTMEELKGKRDDLSRRLKREEDRGQERLAEVQVWLTTVETIENKVNDLLSTRNVELQRMCLCGFCSKSLISSYRYGKRVFSILREVKNLKGEVFEVIAEQAQLSEVEERQLPPTIVGQETMLDKAWTRLMKDEVGIMGMYGMGGVGKTILLTQINNKFSNDRCGFDYVIWVVVSKELQMEKIQDEVAKKVGLYEEEWGKEGKSQKTNKLYNFLKKKKFVLFLDDIWEKVDLTEIGVPFPTRQNKCKVAFTTRSQDVCARMGEENPMEVQCLSENDAFDLFQKKVGQITLGSDPEIPDLAKIVARKCCGLPLALNVIGETMSCKRTIHEWRHAIDVLNSYAAEFSGMEDKILPLLKYSYDNIKEEHVKSCLLYCALYPEDAKISKEKLMEYWICEGIIDGSEGIQRAENKGYEIIGNLVRSSLLMKEVSKDDIEMVHMHDVVREMALWIASDLGIQKEAFVVHAGVGLREFPMVKNWNVVRRMSLMNNEIHHLNVSFKCIELTTLLLQKIHLESISSKFFKFKPMLVVLDLSSNSLITELPEGISELVSLQYLNLSDTGIRHLPKSLQELKKLIHLDLENTQNLSSIDGISRVHNLKVLKLSGSGFSWDLITVLELETLQHLEILTTSIDRPPGPEQFLRSHRLTSRTRYLNISNYNSKLESPGISLPVTMERLRNFSINGCNISEIKMVRVFSFLSLTYVDIVNCNYLRDLTFLMFAPNLKRLHITKAKKLEDIINKEKACEGEDSGIVPFLKLNYLRLAYLPKLMNIYWRPLPIPCLLTIEVICCPELKKLPIDSKSGKKGENGLVIRYSSRNWIESVEWEDQATKTRFLSSCQEFPDRERF